MKGDAGMAVAVVVAVAVAAAPLASGQCTSTRCLTSGPFTVSWSLDNSTGTPQVRFDAKASGVPSNGYLGIGFNSAGQMSGSLIVECIYFNGMGSTQLAYATSQSTPSVINNGEALLGSARTVGYNAGTGELSCSFMRPFDAIPSLMNFQSLATHRCLLAAKGPASSNMMVGYHGSERAVLGCGVDFATGALGGGSTALAVIIGVAVLLAIAVGVSMLFFNRPTTS